MWDKSVLLGTGFDIKASIMSVARVGAVEQYLKDVAPTVDDIIALSSEGFQDVIFCSVGLGSVVVICKGLSEEPRSGLDRCLIGAHGVLGRKDKLPCTCGSLDR